MKQKHLQPLTLAFIIFAGLLFVRFFFPKPELNQGLTMQTGSFPAGVTNAGGTTVFKGQY